MEKKNRYAHQMMHLFLGILVFIPIAILLYFSPDLIKLLGSPFLYLPEKLEWIHLPAKNEVIKVDPATQGHTIFFGKPGGYVVYTDDIDLLFLQASQTDKKRGPWLVEETEQGPIAFYFVSRGIRPYDTTLAKGRPFLCFTIVKPGSYEFAFNWPGGEAASISILPDYMNGKEDILLTVYFAQLAFLAGLWWAVYHLFTLKKRRADKIEQKEKAIRARQLWNVIELKR
ncbi:MAG: hypothetical protein EHM45_05345 [Desulfobacteraceae bacterium]|nr:MAG: hypothetical protein EHM45_05345 [Desulfobacteraceae bacterium]